MKTTILSNYRRLRSAGMGGIVGADAQRCLATARAIDRFRRLEEAELVRLQVEPEEENYFDVYGEPDDPRERERIVAELKRYGCWWACAEFRAHRADDWEHADSCGMLTGYRNPRDPFECEIVADLMAAAVAAVDTALDITRDAIRARRAEAVESFAMACRDIATVAA